MSLAFRAIWVTAYRELLRFLSNRTRLISSFTMPVLLLIVFSAGFSNTIGALIPGVNFTQFMYPGIIAMTAFQVSLMSGLTIVWDREFGFLKEVLVAPLPRGGIIAGKAIGTAVIALFQGLIMLLLAPFLDVSIDVALVIQLIPVLVLISLTFSGLGLLLGSRMRSQQGFQMVMQVLLLPLMFASGVFFPLGNVPAWLGALSKVNPLTYGADAVRQLFLGAPSADSIVSVTVFGHTMSILDDMMVVVALGVVFLLTAAAAFSRRD
ncbi:MAG: ABC transporter permease [Dehalogenimonas sp.]